MKSSCKLGSAWDTWQRAGERVKGKSFVEITEAAKEFAYNDAFAWPIQGQHARYKAFMEGALS